MTENNKQLTRSQKNDVFLILEKSGLSPVLSTFKWTGIDSSEVESSGSELLEYNEEDSFDCTFSSLECDDASRTYVFRFWGQGVRYYPEYFPNSSFGWHSPEGPESWVNVRTRLKDWADSLARELLVPDLWATPQDMARQFFGTVFTQGSTEFLSQEEVQHIHRASLKYRQRLSSQYQLRLEQQEEIDARLDYLVREASNQPRRAWFHTAIGVIVAIAACIRPEAAVFAGVAALFASSFSLSSKALPDGHPEKRV